MDYSYNIWYFALAALVLTWIAFRPALKLAQRFHIVDQPNKRKLQDHPIPAFGGAAVAVGVFIPLIYAAFHFSSPQIWYQLVVMAVLLLIGIADDIYDVPAWFRLMVEIFLIWFFLWGTHAIIEDLHGLFGRDDLISVYTGLPLSILAGVGIINAINLIDGVDGYSSGYGIVANTLFAVIFYMVGDGISALFSVVAVAALIPFYFHNVFGEKSKMYIGDGGSLLIGMIMVCDVFALLTHDAPSQLLEQNGVGVVALALAILCIPVFDTLRVMFARILKRQSPLQSDKTHLHHRFIALGFSHVGTSISILIMNLIVVALWYLSYRLGASIDLQFWIVVMLGILATAGFYYGTLYGEKHHTKIYAFLCRIGQRTQVQQKGFWKGMQKLIDTI